MRMRSAWTLGTCEAKKGIVVICSLDTHAEAILFVQDLIRRRGHDPILLDFSMIEAPPFAGDCTCEQVAARGGMPIEKVRESYRRDRDAATNNQIRGGVVTVADLWRQGRIHGVIGIGGSLASLVATSIMHTLPFGFPKLVASPAAADPAFIEKYVGTRDITMHHTVLEVGRLNPLLKCQLTNAVGAMCGLVEMTRGIEFSSDKPLVAVSSFDFGETAVRAALGMLDEAGFTPVVCHAAGRGERAIEELVRDGAFAGIIDFCTGGVIENLFRGNRDPGPARLMAAIGRGIPAVIAPGGLDMLSYGGRADKLAQTSGRVQYDEDAPHVQVRTTIEELLLAADTIAERLNRARGPVTFALPLMGWSALDREDCPLFDPQADGAFARRLEDSLESNVALVKVNSNLDTREFARAAVDEFIRLFSASTTNKQSVANAR